MDGIISYIHAETVACWTIVGKQQLSAEKSNYQKGKPDYPADDSTIYAKLFLNNPLNKYVPFYNKLLFFAALDKF